MIARILAYATTRVLRGVNYTLIVHYFISTGIRNVLSAMSRLFVF